MTALLRIKFERRLLRQYTMKVLVTGATGTVGGEVVKALLQRGADASRTRCRQETSHAIQHFDLAYKKPSGRLR
jgi:NAD(P)-dependent dehydrogenase (short-subunit alcohol dehydrogenase family)